jgi:hypothetical protein
LPPEQLRGEPLDVRADIYAVGATLYYLLTGQPPFEARDLRELVDRVNHEAPKSPRTLRPEIPSGLAAVILRCLAKSPAQRPSSYPALAELLRPFSAIGEMPAPLRLRILACAVDLLILSVPFTIWKGVRADITINGVTADPPWLPWAWLLNLAYFFVLEAWWSASLGKRLFGLHLASPGGAGWAMRVARRTIVFHIPWLVFSSLLLSVGPIGPMTDRPLGANSTLRAADTRSLIQGATTLTLVAVLFATARRRNGWAGLHELASGTRVVSRAAVQIRSRRSTGVALTLDDLPAARGSRYGPFIATVDAGDSGADLVVGFDPVLRRRVWIHLVSPRTDAIGAVRRDLSRPGRLHWLTGRRTGSDNWDAFEAPDGQPLLAALRDGAPQWSTLKAWLVDLSAELVAAAADNSMPVLRLDRLWVRDDGRLLLLDFAAPRPGSRPSPEPDGRTSPDVDLAPVQLLSLTAQLGLSPANGGQGLMPLSARTVLQSWSGQTPPSLADAHAALVRVAGGPDRVKRARRALPMVLVAVPLLGMMGFITLVIMPTMDRFFGRETTEMLGLLESLYAPTPPPGSRLVDPGVRQAMEIYVAGKHSARLRDPGFWSSPVIQQGIGKRLQPTADSVATRHPSVSPEQLARATTTIAPELERLRARQRRESLSALTPIIVMVITAGMMLIVLLLSIVSSLIVPGGVFTRMLGHAVVTRRGSEIGRSMSLGRVIVAWAPAIAWLLYLASSPKVQGFVPTPSEPMLGTFLTLAALGIGAIVTIVRPERGPHDWLLGTWVVPR